MNTHKQALENICAQYPLKSTIHFHPLVNMLVDESGIELRDSRIRN